MKRFHVPQGRIKNGVAFLDADQARHLARVLRMRQGDEVIVFNPRAEYVATVVTIGTKQARLEIVAEMDSRPALPLKLCLAQAVIKSKRMEFVIEKATELGVKRIIPVMTARSVPKPKSEDTGRAARWKKIAQSAASQSGRMDIPVIEKPVSFGNLVDVRADVKVILYEGEKRCGLGRVVRRWDKIKKKSPLPEVMLMVGPEGGFTSEEVGRAVDSGWLTWGLGDVLLRAETASIVGCAVLMHALAGRLG